MDGCSAVVSTYVDCSQAAVKLAIMTLSSHSFPEILTTIRFYYHGSSHFHVLPITAPPAACGGTVPAGTSVSDERRSSVRDGGVRWRWPCGCGFGSWLKSVGQNREPPLSTSKRRLSARQQRSVDSRAG